MSLPRALLPNQVSTVRLIMICSHLGLDYQFFGENYNLRARAAGRAVIPAQHSFKIFDRGMICCFCSSADLANTCPARPYKVKIIHNPRENDFNAQKHWNRLLLISKFLCLSWHSKSFMILQILNVL